MSAKTDANHLAEERTDLALERTIMAANRTLLAWVRTAISMIGFGFTVYKFLQYMRQDNSPLQPLWEARNLGLTFIGLGVFSLAIAVIQHWRLAKRLRIQGHLPPFDLSLAVAGVVALIGILAFVNVLFQIGPF